MTPTTILSYSNQNLTIIVQQFLTIKTKFERWYTKVTAFVGGLGLLEHLVKVFLELGVPFDELVDEDRSDSHPQNVLPRICHK